MVPRLVEGVEVSAPEGAKPLEAAEADALRSMLRAVVTDGSGRGLADVPGPPVIAKTGTAEFGAGDDLQTHAWMIAAQGDLAVAVFVEVGESGSGTAGPILEAFLRRRALSRDRTRAKSGPPVAWGQRGALVDFAVLPPKSTDHSTHGPCRLSCFRSPVTSWRP